MRIVVVGAGIAGLTATLALLKAGFEVLLLERAEEIKESGAGIQITSNGVKVLRELGLEERLAAASVFPEMIVYRSSDTGEQLYERPLGQKGVELYGAPCYQAHRGDLINILATALPHGVLRLSKRVTGVEQDPQSIEVTTYDGETFAADLVVAADGIHSALRELVTGPRSPRFSGLCSWRALIPADRLRAEEIGQRGYVWSGVGRSVVAYWVRPGTLFNFVGTVPSTEIKQESWTQSGDTEELRNSFAGCEPALERIVSAIEEPFVTGLYDHEPLECWTKGRITLVGDAAHAMMPFLAQGACQAMEDGLVLARSIARVGRTSLAGGLAQYEKLRRPRTTHVQSRARAFVKQLHETDSAEIKARNGTWAGMAAIDPLAETQWGWIYRYDATREAAVSDEKVSKPPAMLRPQVQSAVDAWRDAFSPTELARGTAGMRAGYRRFAKNNYHRLPEEFVKNAPGQPWISATGLRPMPVAGQPAILYLHGGGYVLGDPEDVAGFCWRLASVAGAQVLPVRYRLAPEYPYPAAVVDALAAFETACASGLSPDQVFLAGDGAGGGLALATALALGKSGKPRPGGIIAISPMTDLTLSGPSVRDFSGYDPAADRDRLIVFAGSYIQYANPNEPTASPLFGNLSLLPRTMLIAATNEVLVSDTIRLAERASQAGVEIDLKLFKDSVHAFPLFAAFSDAEDAIASIGAFVRKTSLPLSEGKREIKYY